MPGKKMINQNNFAGEILRATIDGMKQDQKSIIMGLGVTDPKGVFGTTFGLAENFGSERVIETPTSENAMTGVGVGLAISGHRTILVHQRLDFFLLAMDQLVNSAAKWHYMYGGQKSVPLTIRLVLGRGWGQGPTHSQNLHAWFAHIPGLKVLMPAFTEDVYPMLRAAIDDPNPVIFLEDRWLHSQHGNFKEHKPGSKFEFGNARLVRKGSDLTVISSGYGSILSLNAVDYLAKNGVDAELIDLRSIKPVDLNSIVSSVNKTGKVLIVDSGHEFSGFASEIVKLVVVNSFSSLKSAPSVIAGRNVPEPTSHGVIRDFKFGAFEIAQKAFELMNRTTPIDCRNSLKPILSDVPNENFKGPF
jgi:pyruvate/2-oxoglutarate/acetoin dehydrogenase E1 component